MRLACASVSVFAEASFGKLRTSRSETIAVIEALSRFAIHHGESEVIVTLLD
jgi:hypothetical protein